jgi:hypothetical protein
MTSLLISGWLNQARYITHKGTIWTREARVGDIPLEWITCARHGCRGDIRAKDSSMIGLEILEVRWRPMKAGGMARFGEGWYWVDHGGFSDVG